jgi:microcystin-dependent protein
MAEPFLGEIRVFAFGFAPRGWAACDGQLFAINQNQALHSLLGTIYGGDGKTTFALPDLRARAPMHQGGVHTLGDRGGESFHTLNLNEMPMHAHIANATDTYATSPAPTNNLFALAPAAIGTPYGAAANLQSMAPATLAATGGSQPHENRQPFLALNFNIALQGIFPSPT